MFFTERGYSYSASADQEGLTFHCVGHDSTWITHLAECRCLPRFRGSSDTLPPLFPRSPGPDNEQKSSSNSDW
jgi:hypothetical protein